MEQMIRLKVRMLSNYVKDSHFGSQSEGAIAGYGPAGHMQGGSDN